MGYEVTDAEELEIECGETLMCCSAVSEVALQAELIDAQVEYLFTLTQRLGVNYDDLGTYFEDPYGEGEGGNEFDQDEGDNPADNDEVPATRH